MSTPASIPSDTIPIGGQNIDVSSEDFDAPTNPGFIRGFFVETQGAVKVDFASGAPDNFKTEFTYPLCVPGVEYRGRIVKIYTDGTDATGIAVLI